MRNTQPLPEMNEAVISRFWSHVKIGPSEACWPWTGATSGGYGLLEIKRKAIKAHRIALFLGSGVDPAPLYSLHRCDNPPCCNPEHLYRGTYDDNMRDRMERPKPPKRPPQRRMRSKDARAYVKAQVWAA